MHRSGMFSTMSIKCLHTASSFVFALLMLAMKIAADDIQGCGGFVEASASLTRLRKPSDPKLDYSDITVELHTLDGLVKDKIQCAPNGYYFLPVYDKGSFLLKIDGPKGWSFDPEQVPVIVDSTGCNGNEDINFHYTGFTLSGRVLGAAGGDSCAAIGEGPAGVKVILTPVHAAGLGDPIHVTTVAGGTFAFSNLPIGNYRLEATHPILNVTATRSQEVTLGWDNANVDDLFYVPGYKVEGSVLSQGNPVLGVHIYLHSNDVKSIYCPQGAGNSPWNIQSLCHTISDADGRFQFSNVPCGKYTLVPYYKGENTVFDVFPSSIDVSVVHESMSLKQAFQVTGFSVGGRVIDSNGDGIENVRLFVDDVERATTGSNGYYKLDQVTSTRYDIKASKPHYKFSSLSKFMVLPNMELIPDIVATTYEVCGTINALSSAHVVKRQVALTHGFPSVKPQTKYVNATGGFCFEVTPGEYRLSPLAMPSDTRAGVIFSPAYLDLVVSGPILDAVFNQAQVTISGYVKCKVECGSVVTVSLTPIVSTKDTETLATSQVFHLSNEDTQFSFSKVFPGKYKIEVEHKSSGSEDDWCWETKSVTIDVGATDISGISFVQRGYWLRIESTHDSSAFTLQQGKDAIPLQIKKGWQNVCIESPGVHELGFLWPCVFFGSLSFQFDTSKPSVIHLVGQKYVLTGYIHIDSRIYPHSNNLENAILVDIRREENGAIVDGQNYARLISHANKTNPIAIYEYAHWAQLNDKLIFAPRHIRITEEVNVTAAGGSQHILFYPREHHVHVESDGCQPAIPEFIGRPGTYITGSVSPSLPGVGIIITAQEASVSSLKAGEIAATAVTGEDGTYIAGPLYDDTTYSVQAEKNGYHLKFVGNNSFSCQKLGQIVVLISPGEGAEDLLPSLLLSLSGDDGYRKNAVALPGENFTFDGLFPGSFYLRPVLKEYSFSPAAQSLELGSGERLEVMFLARRVAYSVHGVVTSLSGKPEPGISMEARSDSRGYYEETITDTDGKYRLRGLLPHTSYVIKVIIKDEPRASFKLERASPGHVNIEISETDITGLDFVIFEQLPMTILTGSVEGDDLERWQPYITVEVISVLEQGKVERAIPLPLSYFFEIQGLQKGKYLLRLVFRLPSKTHIFNSSEIEVDLEGKGYAHVGPLGFYAEEFHHKQDLTPTPFLPAVVGVSVIAVFATMPRLKDGYQWLIGSGIASVASLAPKREIRKASTKKRTY